MGVTRVTLAVALAMIAALGVAQSAAASGPWQELQRPLKLPHVPTGETCPVSSVDQRVDWESVNIFAGVGIGRGPVYPGLGSQGNFSVDDPFLGMFEGKLFWYADPSYGGRALIRGRRLDGSGSVRFPKRGKLKPELRFGPDDTVQWNGRPPGGRGLPTSTAVPTSGCYGAQIDGTSFSRTVIFTASTP